MTRRAHIASAAVATTIACVALAALVSKAIGPPCVLDERSEWDRPACPEPRIGRAD